MKRFSSFLLLALPLASQLFFSCSKSPLHEDPQPSAATSQNATAAGAQVAVPFTQAATGLARTTFFLYRDTEPSGGGKLYSWTYSTSQTFPAPAGYPGAPTYFPSPGAISVAARLDYSLPIIVTAQGDVAFLNNLTNSWVTINSSGLKFTKIASRDLKIANDGGLKISGLLYGIGNDKQVYQFNAASLNWVVLGGMSATDITVDAYGRAYVIGTASGTFSPAVYGTNSAYGQTFASWVYYTTPSDGFPLSISTTTPNASGLIITIGQNGRRSPSRIMYKPILNSGPSQYDWQQLADAATTFGSTRYFTFAGGDDYGQTMWVASSDANYNFQFTINP